MDLALNNLQRLIYHKIQTIQQTTNLSSKSQSKKMQFIFLFF